MCIRQAAEKRQRAAIDTTKIKGRGLHGVKFGDTVAQMIFSDPSDAVNFARHLVPERGVQKVSIVAVTEKIEKEFLR